MKYKLIVADFDDTTVGKDLVISNITISAIHEYIKAGGTFVFCTGRMTESIISYARKLGLKGEIMGYQGAETADIETGNVLYSHTIDSKIAEDVCLFLENNGWYYQIYTDGYFWVDKANDYSRHYAVFSGVQMKETGVKLSTSIRENNISPLKIMLILDSSQNNKVLSKVRKKYAKSLTINRSKPTLVEIVSNSIDKGKAVENYAKRHGFKREEIICIGDGLSDIPMIEYAGLGVAMENGDELVKKSAKVIAPHCDEDGLAFIINKYGLNIN